MKLSYPIFLLYTNPARQWIEDAMNHLGRISQKVVSEQASVRSPFGRADHLLTPTVANLYAHYYSVDSLARGRQ
jgi:hypothetical protein